MTKIEKVYKQFVDCRTQASIKLAEYALQYIDKSFKKYLEIESIRLKFEDGLLVDISISNYDGNGFKNYKWYSPLDKEHLMLSDLNSGLMFLNSFGRDVIQQIYSPNSTYLYNREDRIACVLET